MIDKLTGLSNIVGLLDWLHSLSNKNCSFPFSLVAIQLTALWQVNRTEGRDAGDVLLKNCADTLREMYSGSIFRAGGDKFVVFLENTDCSLNVHLAQRLAEKINSAINNPSLRPARIAVIQFTQQKEATPGNVLACLYVALADRFHEIAQSRPVEFQAGKISTMKEYPWMMVDLADQMMQVGNLADRSLQLSQTDSVSMLPNLRAAKQEIEAALIQAMQRGEFFAILLVDGDNLRRFNSVSYEAGDEAIRLIGAALQSQLRETDFLARYRSGDEFLVLLRNTTYDRAFYIAQRLCWAVDRASNAWLFPTTVSIGVAVYPEQGKTIQDLLHTAESGLNQAKIQGKNQVVMHVADVKHA